MTVFLRGGARGDIKLVKFLSWSGTNAPANAPFFKHKPMPTPNRILDEVEDEDSHLAAKDPSAESLRWHYRLGHLPFDRIKLLSKLGYLPSNLQHVQNPKCAGCLFGAMTKKPWRTKGKKGRGLSHVAKAPGQIVSVDQMESSTTGFISQLKGRLTRRRYRAATIFVDQYSKLSYVHLQEGLTSAETVEAKKSFEAFARSMGVQIKHYHADNGRFADNAFIQSVQDSGQTISYCGVNAHFQNGVAEKRIRDLQDQARKQVLHAKARWPKAVSIHLWPYALRNANYLRQVTPDQTDGTCPLQRFSGGDISHNPKVHHAFGCPVYALQNTLASGG